MALLNLIGFETGDASEISSIAGTGSVQSTTKRTGTYAARINPTTTNTGTVIPIYRYGTTAKDAVTIAETETYIGFAFRVDTLPGSNDEIILYSSCSAGLSSVLVQTLRITSAGLIRLYNAESGTPALLATGATALSTGTWYYLELWLGAGDGAATDNYELRIDGVTEFSGTAQFGAGGATRGSCAFGKVENRNGQTVDYYYDDIYFDNAGFLGNVHILVAVPTGNSATNTGWTASTGQKWDCINEIPPSGTDYIQSLTTAGTRRYSATHASAATLGITGDILGVKVVARMREASSTTTLGALLIRTGGSNFNSTEVDIGSTTVITMASVLETDPATGVAWTESGFNAAEPGVQRSTSDTSNIRCEALYLMVAWVEQTLFEGTSALALPFPIMTASGKQVQQATSALTLPFPVMTSDGDQVLQSTAALVLPFPVMTAVGEYIPATRTGSGSLVLPFPILTATGSQVISGTGAFTLPFPILTASGTHTDIKGNASLVLPFPVMSASGTYTIQGTGSFVLPFPIMTATGLKVYTATAGVVLPFPILEATGFPANVASASLVLPFPVLTASGTMYILGTAVLTLPFPILTAQAFLILPTHVFESLLAFPKYSAVITMPNYEADLSLPEPSQVLSAQDFETLLSIPNQSAPRSL